jgi:hypothetical protein
MVRSLHMPVTIWTNSFLSLKQLHEKYDARLGGYQSYQYWSSQIATSEWAALSDMGIEQPVTRKEMRYFKIKDFLEAASSKPASSFPDYNMNGAEFAPIMRHVKQLLVPPRYIKGKRLYPPAWDPFKTRSGAKLHKDESKQNESSYDCEACGVRHGRGQHTAAGKKKLSERYAEKHKSGTSKPNHKNAVWTKRAQSVKKDSNTRTKNSKGQLLNRDGTVLKCHGCGKPGVIEPRCPVCTKQPKHENHSAEVTLTKSKNRHLRRKRKLALVKARLATAKGASAEATAAADAILHESFASVGTGNAAPRAKRQRGNSASSNLNSNPVLGLSNLKISLAKLKAVTNATRLAPKPLSARLTAPLSNARHPQRTKKIITRKDFSALPAHATWADGLAGATPMQGMPNGKALPLPSSSLAKPSARSPDLR